MKFGMGKWGGGGGGVLRKSTDDERSKSMHVRMRMTEHSTHLLCESWNFLMRTPVATTYKQIYLLRPPARMQLPSEV